MPSKLFLRGDSEELWLNDAADQIVAIVCEARRPGPKQDMFLRLEQLPYLRGELPRPAYIDPSAVMAVVPLDPRELEASYADLPEWLEQS